MKSLKITGILTTFSVTEMKDFGKFISSPFFSRGRNVVPVFKAIKKFYPEFNDYRYEKKNIFRRAYKDKKFSSTVFRRLVSDLTLLAEEYIRYLWCNSDSIDREFALAQGYSMKKNFKAMTAPLKKISGLLQSVPVNQSYFENYYKLQNIYIDYFQCKDDNHRLHIENSFKIGEYLVLVFLSKLPLILHDNFVLGFAYNVDRVENILGAFTQNFKIDGFLSFLSEKKERNFKLAALYLLLIKLFEPAEKIENKRRNNNIYLIALREYKDLFIELDLNEQHIIGVLLTTYCTLRILEGEDLFVKYILELYNFMHQENTLLYSGFIPYQIYVDYVMKASMLNRVKDMESFINNYTDKLNPKVKKSAFEQSMALLLINKKDYNGSLELLKNIKPFDIKNECEIRVLQAINYYEMGYNENLEHLIETTVKLLTKNKNITENRKNIYTPFFKYLKKLIYINKIEKNDFEAVQIITNIKSEKYFTFKKWILEKYSENISVKQNK